jgi:hypothetical protein
MIATLIMNFETGSEFEQIFIISIQVIFIQKHQDEEEIERHYENF